MIIKPCHLKSLKNKQTKTFKGKKYIRKLMNKNSIFFFGDFMMFNISQLCKICNML